MKTWMTWARLMARPQPVQPPYPLRPHVSLALSPLGFSCVSMCGSTVQCIQTHCLSSLCILVHSDAYDAHDDASIFPWKCGPTVWCIQVYSFAFLRILVHTDAYDASKIAPRGAHPNRVLFPIGVSLLYRNPVQDLAANLQFLLGGQR